MTHSRARIHELLSSRGLAPRRDLGQNFVADPNTVRRIARMAELRAGDQVIEIGPGFGSLTLALAETGAEIVAVEVDEGLADALAGVVGELPNVRVLRADATTLGWAEELDPHGDHTVVANLPYNVATPLVCDILDHVPQVRRMVVMVQREVAERFVAAPRSKAYGAVSVKVAYWASARIGGYVPATVFVPRPKVESALAVIERRTPPYQGEVEPADLFELVRLGFRHRRKMLRGSLAGRVDDTAFAAAGIDPRRRPEELDVDDWCRLVLAANGSGTP